MTSQRPWTITLLCAAITACLAIAPGTAAAQEPSFARGPNPTEAGISASTGPFAIASIDVPDSATPGFGSATIAYPTDRSQGTFGVVAIVPGYTASESSVAWMRPRFASQGFVVITINTQSRYDQPDERGQQLLAALDYVTQRSAVRDRVDASRQAVIGHSMGGGGSMYAAAARPAIEAAIPLTGYALRKTHAVQGAVLVIGAQDDGVAPVEQHSIPFYENATGAEEREYLELRGAGHSVPTSPNTPIARNSIAWLKRFVDNDTRYTQFVCPPPSATGTYSDVRSTCPIG